jgi:hypothetical protein
MAQWHIRHGRWWALQWCRNGWFGLGIHVDWRRRYVDFHFAHCILSLGDWPVYTPIEMSRDPNCRGGIFI